MRRFVLLAGITGLLMRMCCLGECSTVQSSDGMRIAFRDADAAISAISIGSQNLKLNGTAGGFYVADMAAGRLLGKMSYKSEGLPGVRLPATARQSPTGVVIQGEVQDLWVRAR